MHIYFMAQAAMLVPFSGGYSRIAICYAMQHYGRAFLARQEWRRGWWQECGPLPGEARKKSRMTLMYGRLTACQQPNNT